MGDNSASSIAIIGYGCRLPGAGDVEAFDKLLAEERCAVSHVPTDRWSPSGLVHPDRQVAGRAYTNAAGVIEDPFAFDAAFFGISAREAVQMDPQQRLLLEVAWEAIEFAGVTSDRLRGSRTGVYVGASSLEHSNSHMGDPAVIDSRFMTGNALSILANRLSHAFDLHGPSVVIDTACSSALYAFHAAVTALKGGEIDVAIVGGVNLLMAPIPYVGFSRAAMLSSSGLCRAFDAGADGYVRAEGAVVFVIALKSWAKAGGDRIRGHVVGTGINSDGGASSLSVPSAARQASLITNVYQQAGIGPDDLAFIEAHGTGTAVGDPIEAAAIGAAIGRHRSRPLPIGSVKSNVGHLEPAAGLVGLLKAQRALETGVLAPTLHIDSPNPAIDFKALNLYPAQQPVRLPPREKPWIAGVNSFGFGGSNAHVAIEQVPTRPLAPVEAADQAPLVISAATESALKSMAAKWSDRLSGASAEEKARLANAAAHRRDWHKHRLVVLPGADGHNGLDEFLADRPGHWVSGSALSADSTRNAFVFSGNGSQWPGMGREAFLGDPVFRAAFEAVSAAVHDADGPDLTEALFAADLDERLREAIYAQPLLLALQIALVQALNARGVHADCVTGHSVGEVAAAWAAGALTVEQAATLSVRRAECQSELRGSGTMAAALASAEQAGALIERLALEQISIAADNSPRGATVSGKVEAIERLMAEARRLRIPMRRLHIDYPFHSPLMNRIEAPLRAALADLSPQPGLLPFYSTTFAEVVPGEALDAAYWWQNARQPVRFRETIAQVARDGTTVFIEIGPQPVLQNYVSDTLRLVGQAFAYVPGLRRQGKSAGLPARVVADIAASGGRLDRDTLFGPQLPQTEPLPSYAWDHKEFRQMPTADELNVARRPEAHPLLGWKANAGDTIWRRSLDPADPAWLGDHVVDGVAVVPGAVFAELALAAGTAVFGDGPVQLTDLDILRPLSLGGGMIELRTQIDPASGRVLVESRHQSRHEPIMRHAVASVRQVASAHGSVVASVAEAGEPCEALYASLAAIGLSYGPAFRRAAHVSRAGDTVTGAFTPSLAEDGAGWRLDPTSLDAAFHLLLAAVRDQDAPAESEDRLVPVRIGSLKLVRPGETVVGAKLTLLRRGRRTAVANLALFSAEGQLIAAVGDVRFAALRSTRRQITASTAWSEIDVPKRFDPAEPANRSQAWQDAAGRLQVLGLAAAELGEASAATLVIDAACRRIIWEAARRIAPQGGISFQARRILPPRHAAALLFGLRALEADGIYDADADMVTETAPVPELGALADALLATEPASMHRLMPALRLELAFRQGDAQSGQSVQPNADGWNTLVSAAADFCCEADPARPLDVLVLGKPPANLLQRLKRHGAGSVCLAASPQDMPPEFGMVDLVVVGAPARLAPSDRDWLKTHLVQRGLILTAWHETSLLDNLLALLGGASTNMAPNALPSFFGDDEDWGVSLLYGRAQEERVAVIEHLSAPPVVPNGARIPSVIVSDRGGPGMAAAVALQEALSSFGHHARIIDDFAAVPKGVDIVIVRTAISRDDEPLKTLRSRFDDLQYLTRTAQPGRIWIASLGAGPQRLGDCALSQLLRVLANEQPDLDVRFIHGQADQAADSARLVARAMLSPSAEIAQTVTSKVALVRRIEPLEQSAGAGAGEEATAPQLLMLDIGRGSGLEALAWRPAARRTPGPGEVEIEVAATGLNFRDVMWAMGVLPEEALEDGFSGLGLGMECSGTVVAAGRGARWSVGTRVMAFAPNAFATHVTVADSAAHVLPDWIGFIEAASLPVAVATAQHALVELGRVGAGDVVLIHGGAGGVGLAALQIALARGARVLATAGTPEKRALLSLMGASAVFDSRTLDFADGVMAATDGRGVDVALNSLAGDAMTATLQCMAPFGRFVELGKRDLYGNTSVGLRPLRRNITYFAVDLDAMLAAKPAMAGTLLAALADGLTTGEMMPLPHQVLGADDTQEAFRLMQRSGHIGKIVLTPPAAPAAAEPAPPLARPDGAWLVTGGTRGFGLAFASRLAARGAGMLWLVSRSGKIDAADEPVLAAMRRGGTAVKVVSCDVTDATAMARLIAGIKASDIPLTGVAHAAALFDDAAISVVDGQRLAQSAAPKVIGGVLLDRLTEGLPLEHFVVFSSISVALGNPGQVAYVAANGALEALACRRVAQGKPGLAVRWPPIADAGLLATDAAARAMLERRGAGLYSAQEALDVFEKAQATDNRSPVLGFGRLNLGDLAAALPFLRTPLFERMASEEQDKPDSGQGADLRAELAGLDDQPALERLLQTLRVEAMRVLRQEGDQIDAARPLQELGFDSLMAVELKMALEERYGFSMVGAMGTENVTLNDLAIEALATVRQASDRPNAGDDGVSSQLARHLDAATVAVFARHLTEPEGRA